MDLKDCAVKDYSVDGFCKFAEAVAKRLGVSSNRDYKKYVADSCKNMRKAVDKFRDTIPADEGERFKWQSSVHGENGQYIKKVYDAYFNQVFVKNLNEFIKVYETACVGLLSPLKVSKLRSAFRKIFSKSKKQPELTPTERDRIMASLLQLKRATNEKAHQFFNEICAHDEFKNLSVHMPQRFANNKTEWDMGVVKCKNEEYTLPAKNDQFRNIGANQNIIVDNSNNCYYLRDNNKKLCKLNADGNVIGVLQQGSFGEPLGAVVNRHKDFFGF
ncbi:MAG: hypothetical protein Q4D57_05750 [Clostridia bacterium]|nr:hypothetical protein [Clostridia bacterium]